MRIQVVNFNLKDLSHEEFLEMCGGLAPVFSEIPGLVSKLWLANPQTNTYGGVYTWESADAMAAFAQSDLFEQLTTNPHLVNLTATDFSVLDQPSRVTRGVRAAAA